ncbi:YgaP family membrane protein [Rhodovulum sp. DZ06]|uniref:YgaP family membrane protein n=1 Tax=Rhodovulum sp. DZ06 TaxID=3425126 RepID=UPI003D334360
MTFTKNMGKIDRAIRMVVGLALMLMAALQIIPGWGWIGVIFVATSFLSFCPLYTVLGFKTCSDC